ncbi:rab-GTPase-TBC domain-containing protein [Sarocladium implicatum]|nr:rab-GTPase-TBC domain-containing protein [Sarocladium implicatum]
MTHMALHQPPALRGDYQDSLPLHLNRSQNDAHMPMRSTPRSQPFTEPSPRQQYLPQFPPGPEPSFQSPPPAPISPRWDSISNGPSPTTSRFPHLTPTTSADSWNMPPSDPPSRPLTAKSSVTDLRSPEGLAVENFSRPRKQSLRQDVPRPRVPNLPLPEQMPDLPYTSPQPSPRHRQYPLMPSSRQDHSFVNTYSHPPFDENYSEPKSPRSRGFPQQPPPHQPAFVSSRLENLGSPSPTGAPAPWLGAEELRSSFRSQLTTSTGFHGANTERSSVLTKDSSVTSLSANADEPSLEDVMGMYEEGFEDKPGDLPRGDAARHRLSLHPELDKQAASLDVVSSETSHQSAYLATVDEDVLKPPKLSSLDKEIRQSKLFFLSPAFASSVAHLASAGEQSTSEKRESDHSRESEPPSQRPSTGGEDRHLNLSSMPPLGQRQASMSPVSTHSEPPLAPVSQTQPIVAEPPNSGKTTPVFNQPVAEPEEPGSRDRYGFKKANQHITRQQYDAWDKGYSEYLGRRKKKWVAFLKENSLMTDRPNRFPDNLKNNAKTKRFIRKGIPPEWRGAAWFYYAGGPAILRAHGGLYEKLLRKTCKLVDQEAIERDLHRTFPDNIKFKPSEGQSGDSSTDSEADSFDSATPSPGQVEGEPPIISSLRRVLRAFSIYNPRIGYCQSLNFLAGLLLLFVETEEQCFWLLNVITHIYLPGTHEISLEGSKVDLSVLMAEIQDTMPAVWDKIGGDLEAQPSSRPATSKSLRRPARMRRKDNAAALSTERLPPITLCMTAWFMSCFIGTLPIETTLRVWDIFFYEGSKTLFRVALSIFKVGESEIRAVKDPMEMFGVVQSMPRRMIDANALMEACFKRRNGFGHLTQNTIDERRQERRDTARHERNEQDNAPKEATSGNVTEMEPEVRRKGTLFGRKKRDASRTRQAEL